MKKVCSETARLLSESRDRRLGLRERIHLRFHMTMCGMCNVYARQLAVISRICKTASDRAPDCCPGQLSEDRKARIREAMKE
jgi:hypothetical protein